ncbi:hypothetical protein AGMMS49571_05320 [Endomicrobiia bacterium]|nr:hypothetical protein AGMMS49523_08500 [Endomicrobiia bacterium]GHT12777.1 hypothetical protein AGMMS49571_05320 [Endomicrobiia bacterium]GHT27689.1 hypothetical protein AGMMS49995_07200 [Endomicrobiia bacterium]
MQSHSTGIRNLNFDEYKKINIVFPSISEQKKIVAKLDKFSENIKRLEDAARKNLQNAKDLFNSVLNETFKNKSAVANDNRQVYKKTHWEVKKLGEVCQFIRGLTYSKKDEVISSSNVVLRANNIDLSTNFLDFSELKYISGTIKIPASKKVRKDSILICTASGSKNHLGKVAFIEKDYPYAFGGFMGLIVPFEEIFSKFLFYIFNSSEYRKFINCLTNGVNINNLRFSQLAEFRFQLPELNDQKKIVARLDKLSAETKKLEIVYQKKIDGLAELKKSVFKQTFDCG